MYHILSTAWSMPTNYPLHYCSVTNIQPLCPCMLLLFLTLHLYCIANSIVPRWLPHSVHPAWTHCTFCVFLPNLYQSWRSSRPWYLAHQIPCWLTVSFQVLHCTAVPAHPGLSHTCPHWLIYLSNYPQTFITITVKSDTVHHFWVFYLAFDPWRWKYCDLSKCLEPHSHIQIVTYHKTCILRHRVVGFS